MANLSKTLHINFCQNRSSIVEVMIKKFLVCFLCLTVYILRTLVSGKIKFMRIFEGFLGGASNDSGVLENVGFSAFAHYIFGTLGNKCSII